MINTLGWIGNIFFLYGAIALSKKHMSGWYAQILANVCYVLQSFYLNNNPLLILSVILIGINIYGIYNGKKLSNKDSIEQKINKEA
jgi:hypothetical protein